jgi:hypothetical protein
MAPLWLSKWHLINGSPLAKSLTISKQKVTIVSKMLGSEGGSRKKGKALG